MALLSSQLYSGHEHGGSEGARVKTQGEGGNKRTRHPTRLDLGNCGERFLVPQSSPRFDERTNNRSVRINAKMRWRTSIFTQRRERFLVRERFLLQKGLLVPPSPVLMRVNQRSVQRNDAWKPIICTIPFHIPHPCHIPHSTPLLKLHYMQRAEHLRDVYVRAQMWKAV